MTPPLPTRLPATAPVCAGRRVADGAAEKRSSSGGGLRFRELFAKEPEPLKSEVQIGRARGLQASLPPFQPRQYITGACE